MTTRGEALITIAKDIKETKRELAEIDRRLIQIRLSHTSAMTQVQVKLNEVLDDVHSAIGREMT